jgi:hypothetical protein
VYFDSHDECRIRESFNGGAAETVISPEHVVISDFVAYAVMVTNTFVPVVIQPTFTG